jgi:hypothetical protein
VAATWTQELSFMKEWLSDRLAWMAAQIPAPPTFSQPGGQVETGFALLLSHPQTGTRNTIYYTLDGSDPRLPGGAISPAAIRYTGPLPLTGDVTIRARLFRGRDWSAMEEASFEVVPDPQDLPGDFDGNGRVDQADLDLVLLHWGRDFAASPIPGWTNALPEGLVDQQELDQALLNWGSVAASLAPARPAAVVGGFEARSADRTVARPVERVFGRHVWWQVATVDALFAALDREGIA